MRPSRCEDMRSRVSVKMSPSETEARALIDKVLAAG